MEGGGGEEPSVREAALLDRQDSGDLAGSDITEDSLNSGPGREGPGREGTDSEATDSEAVNLCTVKQREESAASPQSGQSSSERERQEDLEGSETRRGNGWG